MFANFDSSPREDTHGSPRVKPPLWVYFVLFVYVLLVLTVTFGPSVLVLSGGGGVFGLAVTGLYTLVVIACGASLMVLPVSRSTMRAPRRRAIWFPLVGSATMALALFFGMGIAAHEFAFPGASTRQSENALLVLHLALPAVWFGWVGLFWTLGRPLDPQRFNGRLYKTLLAGSVIEMLVALQMHLVVRRRTECCAGLATGLGIGIGVIVMVIALGPAVYFLCYQRYQQTYARRHNDNLD